MTSLSNSGHRLYELLPEVFRNRDNNAFDGDGNLSKAGDLARYLDAHGELLDQIKNTLDQRLADCFPDQAYAGELACQDWLLPYFAALLDVRLVSPTADGQRLEIANAVAWRKGKGTLRVVEDIVEAIAGYEAELQEAWKRVAVTASLSKPLMPAESYGLSRDEMPSMADPFDASRHPGLPVATIDVREASRAVQTEPSNMAAKSTLFAQTERATWRQIHHHGIPCFANSFEDVSRRTVDLRSPDMQQGHYHPKRLLIYTPRPEGFFMQGIESVTWASRDDNESKFNQLLEKVSDDGVTTYRNKSLGGEAFIPVRIRQVISLGDDFNEFDPDAHTWRFEGVILENRMVVHSGRLELDRCAARTVESHSIDTMLPVLSLHNCLIKSVQAARGLSLLEYCTVLESLLSETLQASDSILPQKIRKDHVGFGDEPPRSGCVRYSCVPEHLMASAESKPSMAVQTISVEQARFYESRFGEQGCAVLHPDTSDEIRFGAEDGGEMGAYHFQRYCLKERAVLDKLNDYMPIGIEPVLIPDMRLQHLPPELKE